MGRRRKSKISKRHSRYISQGQKGGKKRGKNSATKRMHHQNLVSGRLFQNARNWFTKTAYKMPYAKRIIFHEHECILEGSRFA